MMFILAVFVYFLLMTFSDLLCAMCCSQELGAYLRKLSDMEGAYMRQRPAAMWFMKEQDFLECSAEQIVDTVFSRADCLQPIQGGEARQGLEDIMVSLIVLYA